MRSARAACQITTGLFSSVLSDGGRRCRPIRALLTSLGVFALKVSGPRVETGRREFEVLVTRSRDPGEIPTNAIGPPFQDHTDALA
jgi:hypothetical protein